MQRRRGRRVWPLRPAHAASRGPPTHVSGILPFQGAPALLLVEQGHVLGLQPRDGLGPVVLGVKMDLPDLGGGNDQLSSCGGNDSHFLTLIPPLTPTEYLHSSLRGSAPSQRGQALFLLRSEPRSAARLSQSRIPPPACGPWALGSLVLSSAGLLTPEATTLRLGAFALAAGTAWNAPPSRCRIRGEHRPP